MGRPLFMSVNGTAVPDPWGPGFSSDIGRMLSNPWWGIAAQFWGAGALAAYNIFWQPIGYPAAMFPMMPSVKVGVQEISRQITLHENPDPAVNLGGYCPPGTPIYLSGYSQGALVTNIFWRDQVLSPSGQHHNRLHDILDYGGIINFGDPMRCPGIANGNVVAGFAEPKLLDGVVTGGIAGPGCLTAEQTPGCLLSCALDGDLYAAAPVGPSSGVAVDSGPPWHNEPLVGQIETRIYNFVESGSLLTGIMAIATGISQEFGQPLANTIALVHAIFNGLTFLGKGQMAPHWQYQGFVPPMTGWVMARANAYALAA